MERITVSEVLALKKPKVGKVFFIAVDGHGGSGKSTLAAWLSKKLKAQIVHTDDFASWDNPFNWWPLVIKRVFEPIKNGAIILSYPRSKWGKRHHPEPVVNQPVTSVMILEGVSSLRKEFREYVSLGFFVDTPKKFCLQRGVERDTDTGKSSEEVMRIWNTWFEEEDVYIKRDNPKDYADIVIDGTKPLEDQIG